MQQQTNTLNPIEGDILKSLILMSYKQPHLNESSFRWGVVCETRDTKRDPLCPATLRSNYRRRDPDFKRSRTLTLVRTRDGVKQFYRERTKWKIQIPFLGSLLGRLFPA
jgi:hypothetical protein